MFQTKVVEKIKLHLIFFPENHAMWTNMVDPNRSQMAV